MVTVFLDLLESACQGVFDGVMVPVWYPQPSLLLVDAHDKGAPLCHTHQLTREMAGDKSGSGIKCRGSRGMLPRKF